MRRARPLPGVPGAGLIYRLAAWVGITVMRLQRWRLDVIGLDHVPAEGGCLIAANHNSYWDFFAVGYGPYLELGRPVRIMAKHTLFEIPIFGALLRRTGCIPVDRSRGQDAFVHAVKALQAGELVLILPEATISRSFDLLPFRTGAVRLAAAAGVPVVPAVSWGTHRFSTSGRRPRWTWRLPVTVRYDPPLHFGPEVDPEAGIDLLRRRMQVMLDEVIATYPDDSPPGEWWVPARLAGGAPPHEKVVAEYQEWRKRWRLRRRR